MWRQRNSRALLGPVFACFLCASPLLAQSAGTISKTSSGASDRSFGAGVIFEGVMGLSLYGTTTPDQYIQGAAAWGLNGGYALSADYAFAYPRALRSAPVLTPYWGVGAVALQAGDNMWAPRHDENENETDVGVRIPLGLNAVIPRTPVQLGGELVPTVIVAPATYSYLEGGVYARVLF